MRRIDMLQVQRPTERCKNSNHNSETHNSRVVLEEQGSLTVEELFLHGSDYLSDNSSNCSSDDDECDYDCDDTGEKKSTISAAAHDADSAVAAAEEGQMRHNNNDGTNQTICGTFAEAAAAADCNSEDPFNANSMKSDFSTQSSPDNDGFDDDFDSISEASSLTMDSVNRSIVPKWCLLGTVLLVAGILIGVGTVCGTTDSCSRQRQSSSSSDSNMNAVGVRSQGPSLPQRVAAPSIAPALRPSTGHTAVSPTVVGASPSPTSYPTTQPRQAFTTTEELYEAVDQYLELMYGSSSAVGDVVVVEENESSVGGGSADGSDDEEEGDALPEATNLFLRYPTSGQLVLQVKSNNRSTHNISSVVTSVLDTYGHTIGGWDVSGLSNFSRILDVQRHPLAARFNESLSGWSMHNATTLQFAFRGAKRFAGAGLETWNTSRVETLDHTFAGNKAMDADLSLWETGSVTSLNGTFAGCGIFRGVGLNAWDVSRVTTAARMFEGASHFDGPIGRWRTGELRHAEFMFKDADCFSRDLSSWDVSNLENGIGMFENAYSFNGDISTWQTGRMQRFDRMFFKSSTFNGDISRWDTSSAVSMSKMFKHASSFGGDLSDWSVSRVVDLSCMFLGSSFSGDVSLWNVSSARDVSNAFAGLREYDHNLCSWGELMASKAVRETNRPLIVQNAFLSTGCSSTSDPNPDDPSQGPWCARCDTLGSTFDHQHEGQLAVNETIEISTMAVSFLSTAELYTAVDSYLEDPSPLSMASRVYGYPIGQWNVSQLSNFSSVFSIDRNPSVRGFDAALDSWDLGKATTVSAMFSGASSFRGTGLEAWDVSKCTNMSMMFHRAIRFDGDLSAWNTSRVVDFTRMFKGALSFRGDIASWQTSQARTMQSMFNGALLFDASLSTWSTGSVTDFSFMFAHNNHFNAAIGSWSLNSATTIDSMFRSCNAFNRDISGWNVSRVVSMVNVFASAKSFNQDLCEWSTRLDTRKKIKTRNMFKGSACLNARTPDPAHLDSSPYCRSCVM